MSTPPLHIPARAERVDVEPYSVLARYYDQVMDHIDYKGWAAFIARAVKRHGRTFRRGIDFACGTGQLARQLTGFGYDMIGVDGSALMIDAAKSLKPRRGRSLSFQVCDLREMPMVPTQQLAICLYDSLNYLMNEEDVASFFRSALATIEPDGLLVVDLSTDTNSRFHFSDYVMEESLQGATYRRVSRYDLQKRIQHNVFNIYPDDEDVVYVEHHMQRIWPVQSVLDIMRGEAFRVDAIYHEMTFRRGDEESDRVHIVAEPA